MQHQVERIHSPALANGMDPDAYGLKRPRGGWTHGHDAPCRHRVIEAGGESDRSSRCHQHMVRLAIGRPRTGADQLQHRNMNPLHPTGGQ